MSESFAIELWGLRLPDTVIITLAITLGLLAGLWPLSRRMRAHGTSAWQTALETYVGWLRSSLGELFGEDPSPYVPLIGTLMAFIALSNVLGAIPWVRPPTADLDTTVALALVVFCAVPYFGIRRHGLRGYLRKYAEPHLLLLPLNVLGELTRTLALAVRLFGNAMSGQMIVATLVLVAGLLVPVPLMALGVLTGLVQAYIFGILAAVYIAAAVETQQRPAKPTRLEPSHG